MSQHGDSLQQTTVRSAYAAPELTIYGAMAQLTAAGSGMKTENGNPDNCSQNKDGNPCRA